MTTRPYSDCLAQALALCGVPDANVTEVARVKTFINRRARQAYKESDYWPRWLVVGEERIVSEEGLLPYSQEGLQDIGTILRIHEAQPFVDNPAGEYVDWSANSDGVQITGYQPVAASGQTSFTVDLSATPYSPYSGDYIYQGQHGEYPYYLISNSGQVIGSLFVADEILDPGIIEYPYNWFFATAWPAVQADLILRPYEGEPSATPDLVELNGWTRLSMTDAYTIGFTELPTYAAFITYKAAFTPTYGTGDGEESEVPDEWFEWMATGAAASFLFSDKETESALLLEAQAREDLDSSLMEVSRQNGSKVQTRILTHGNMQTRR